MMNAVTNSLLLRDAAVVWHPFSQVGRAQPLLPVVGADGAHLILEDGRRILDGVSSWWCNLHGHSHPSIVQAIAEQAATLDHVLFGGCTHPPAVALAEKIVSALPMPAGKVFFSDNGSTAVEVALKISVQRWRNRGQNRAKIYALENAYHGDTFGAMAVGARGIFSAPFEELLFQVDRFPIEANDEALHRFELGCKSGEVAAFIFEPLVQGAGGFNIYPQSLLDQYLSLCHSYGVVTIADEVMTGFGRIGPLFVSSDLHTTPDIICLSKGLTGGSLPLAATVCRGEIFEDFISKDHSRTFFHGHTFTANPIACAAALASWTLSTSAECTDARQRIHQAHTEFISRLGERGRVSKVRAAGTVLALQLRTEQDHDYLDPIGEKVSRECVAAGVLLRPLGDVLYFMPPYCTTESDLLKTHMIIEQYV
jgi:adenosylmethionine-8-amino-7-oxononanoate aminotransferase